ncbi:MAG: ABC transporter substrate-binding protein [Humidesulfovibrio sp.]|nr:ABC transporter substrate-binding protein [Humidesulfovibrio sp.]
MKRLLLSLIALLSLSSVAWGANLRIITEIAPPLNYTQDGTETGKAMGQAVDIVREVQKRVGDTSQIEVMPWARGYSLAQSNASVMLFSTTRTEEREKLFQWVGPVGFNEWVFLAKKGSPIHLSSLADAKKVGTIGAYKNDARELFLKAQGFTNIDSASEPETILKKMLSGRNDLWLTDKTEYNEMAKKQGIKPAELVPLLTVKKTELYMAFSKATPADVVKKWTAALDSMKADGTYKAIMKKWAQ